MKFIFPAHPESMIPAGPLGVKEGEVETHAVCLNLAKIDAVWKKDIYTYSGIEGMDRKEAKIRGVKEWLKDYDFLFAPIIFLANNNPNNLQFVDGRHTVAFLLEQGVTDAVFIIPSIQRQSILDVFVAETQDLETELVLPDQAWHSSSFDLS